MDTSKTQFNGREEYLAWRAQWRAEYAALSQEIREVKFAKWFCATHQKTSDAQQARYAMISKRYIKPPYGWSPRGTLTGLKEKARQALEVRKASKLEAQRQYLERQAQKAAA